MLKLNRDYSDYTDETDVNYPEGKAVNASTSESYDGTPLLAEFMNDVNAAHIAMYEKAHGSRDGINGHADTQKASQFADAVAKYTDDKVKAHADKRGLADGVHGATSEATPGQIISRDEYGCAKVSAPIENDDIANKKWVLEAIYPVGSLYWSSKSTNPGELFGGTWKQIKDCFVWAKGDSDTINSTGGSKTVTLTEANMPSHSHSFTPSGTITMNAHSHGLNGHRHTFIPEGMVSNHCHTFQPNGTVTSSFSGTTHSFYSPRRDGSIDEGILEGENVKKSFGSSNPKMIEYAGRDNDPSILLQWTDAGTVSSSFGGRREETEYTSPSFSGYSGTTSGNSEETTSATASGSFTGSAGTTESNGSGTDFSIMPPYVIKYCFERIA